jgi:hypothetical protein
MWMEPPEHTSCVIPMNVLANAVGLDVAIYGLTAARGDRE